MADIEIIYRKGYCEFDCMGTEYNTQCHTCAGDLGCEMFNEGKHEKNVIPFGDCIHAKFKYIYKGMSIKNYELEALDDPYNPHLNCMMLKTRNDWYQCEKVVLNGKVIYGEDFDAQPEIIRCKDCKHWTTNIGDSELRDNYCNEAMHGFYYRCSGDDFCSYAESEKYSEGKRGKQEGGKL